MRKINFSKLLIDITKYVANLAVLNLCWLIFSIPILTVIPATDALFSVLNQNERKFKDETKIFKKFLFFFRKNFKKSFKIGTPIFILLFIIYVDFKFLFNLSFTNPYQQIFKYVFYILSIILLILVWYVYPLSKIKDYKFTQLFFHSMILLVNHPLKTLLFLVFVFFHFSILIYMPALLFFFSISGLAAMSSFIVRGLTK